MTRGVERLDAHALARAATAAPAAAAAARGRPPGPTARRSRVACSSLMSASVPDAAFMGAVTERTTLPDAGSSDLRAAADALRSRLPEPLGALADSPTTTAGPGRRAAPSCSRSIDPRALGAASPATRSGCCRRRTRTRSRRAAGRRGFLERVGRARARGRSRPRARRRATRPVTPDRPVAFFCAEYGVHASLPDLLRRPRRARRRHPQGGLRPRAAAGRGRPDVPPRLLPPAHRRAPAGSTSTGSTPTPTALPAALVTGDDGEPLTVTVPIGEREVVAQIWRVDVGRVPLLLLDADRPENDVADRWITSRLYVGDPDTRLAQYVLLGVGGVRALERAGDRARRRAPQRGPRRVRRARARARRDRAGGGSLDDALAVAPRAHGLHHPHAGPGRQRHLPGRAGRARRSRRIAGDARASTPTTLIRLGRTHPDDDAEPFGVTQFALRTSRARQRRQRAATARSRARCGTALWPDRAVDDVPITHVTNGVHIPTWLGEPMRELLDRHLGEGWLDRADRPRDLGRPSTTSRTRSCGPCAARSARELIEFVRERSVIDRLARGDTREYVRGRRRRARPRRADDRLRPPPGHLQAAQPAAAATSTARSRCSARRPPGPAPARRQGAPARRRRQAARAARCSSMKDRAGGRPPRRLPRRLRPRASAPRLVRGCDVWINLPRPPLEASGTCGMKSAINGGLQLSRARRLVGRGLRRHQRLGALRRGRPRPRRPGRAPRRTSSTGCSRRRSCPTSTTATATASRALAARWCAARCARSGRSSAPGACSRTTRGSIYPPVSG